MEFITLLFASDMKVDCITKYALECRILEEK